MQQLAISLEVRFVDSDYGLSARRLWEHTELGQINAFEASISARNELNDAAAFIDVVRFEGEVKILTGVTLAQFNAGEIPSGCSKLEYSEIQSHLLSQRSKSFVQAVSAYLEECSVRRAVRNQHYQFLPVANSTDVFGVPHLFSTLRRRLEGMGKFKVRGEQWLKTIENFQKSGLRAEELECAELFPELLAGDQDNEQCSAAELAELCDFKEYRLSVIAVVADAKRQLRFGAAPEWKLKRTKKLPKAQHDQVRNVAEFDPVLGYRVEQVVHQTLWGAESHWQAVTHEGQVLGSDLEQTLFALKDDAHALAINHAKQSFPKRVALGQFSQYGWTGGASYREWLITLPYYPHSYLSGHFQVRNVLAHVRCDLREGADCEKVLMLQEVQSDWAQRARRAASTGEYDEDDEVTPPFVKEWPALVMKLMLLHASHHGLDAVAWTRGVQQVHRWNGLGAAGLIELYDRTLPRAVNKMMKPFGAACEPLGVFVPTNFSIRQTENGYAVYSPENEVLGTALTLEDARQFVPDQGHELLYEVHGVRLSRSVRAAMLSSGFPAWG